MICPFLLLLGSLVLTIAGASIPGWQDLTLLGVPCVISSAILLLRALAQPKRPQKKWIIVDGSNVMYWKSGEPSIKVVREIVDELRDRGYTPGVVFDANAGYKLEDRYLDDTELAKRLGLQVKQVMVVPKGEQADGTILTAARDHGVRIVTNDRFRDWADSFPEVAQSSTLVRGGYRDGQLWLEL